MSSTSENNVSVRCPLCFRHCTIPSGERGFCGVNRNNEGQLVCDVYEHPRAMQIDPVEKKPLYHFLPGTTCLSVGTEGCNMRCPFCQNYTLVESPARGARTSCESIVNTAREKGCSSLALTYNEPTVFWPFGRELFQLSSRAGLKNIMVSNGMMSAETGREMAAPTHGINIDLKCFTAETYAQKLGGNLQQVFDSISLFYEAGVHVELTTLVVPDFNTDFTAFRKAAEKIRAVSPEIPWHITRFFPTSRYSAEQPTPLADIDFFINILVELGFYYIYSGNTGEDVHTPCPRCGTLLIERFIFGKTKVRIKNGACPECSTPIQGVFHE